MFRVKMLFSTVSISNSNYCFNIFTLPGNWAMLENKLHIWSLFGGDAGAVKWTWRVGSRVRALVYSQQANNKGGMGNLEATKVIKVDFFALLYIVKKERIMYIEILFWIKKIMSITTQNFARITKKNLMKGWTKLLASKKGHWVLALRPLSEKAKCCSSFSSAACSLPGNLPEEASTKPSSKGLWLGLSGPLTCLYGQVCVSWPRPPRPKPITTRPVSLLYSERNAC